jgi:hypothetical protein
MHVFFFFFPLFLIQGRPSVLFRDDQRANNGGDAVIDLGSDATFHSSMKQQLQVIDETVTITSMHRSSNVLKQFESHF